MTTAIRERGIIYRPEMIVAILKGEKTQTRRLINPQPPSVEAVRAIAGIDFHLFTDERSEPKWRVAGPTWAVRELISAEPTWTCPYGITGDRLYVRETWAVHERYDLLPGRNLKDGLQVVYKAGGINELGAIRGRWRSARFMPRRFARLLTELTDVRVQQLQQITEGDTHAEGVIDHYACTPPDLSSPDPDDIGVHRCDPLGDMKRTWDKINDHRGFGWDTNPWIWALTFKVVE